MGFASRLDRWLKGATQRQYITLIVTWSLLLSTIAFYSDSVINRDGMFYVDIAQSMLVDGAALSSERYGWTFLPMLLSLGDIVGLSPLATSKVYAFLCGALIPVMVFVFLSRYQPGYRHLAFMMACFLPWASAYRAELLRDTGAWLFMLLSLYAALRWLESRNIAWSLLLFSSAFIAFLFRIEMALLLSLGLYVPLVIRWRDARQSGERFVTGQGALFILIFFVLILIVANVGYEHAQVYVNNFRYGGPYGTYAEFLGSISAAANKFLNRDLGVFAFFGFFSLVVLKVFSMLGVFCFPIYMAVFQHRYQAVVRADGGMTLMIALLFLLPVGVFIFMNTFILSRYVMPITIALSPFVFAGLVALWRDILGARGRLGFVLVAFLAALSSVTSVSPGKQYIRETGLWLSGQSEGLEPLQIRDKRISFYAGKGYGLTPDAAKQTMTQALSDDYQAVVFTFDVAPGAERMEVERIKKLTGFDVVLYAADNGAGEGAVVLSRADWESSAHSAKRSEISEQ